MSDEDIARELAVQMLGFDFNPPDVHRIASHLLPAVRKLVAVELRAEREAVLQALVRHGQGETNLYDEIGHGAHR